MTDPILPGIAELERHLRIELHPDVLAMLRENGENSVVADTQGFLKEADNRCKAIREISGVCDFGAVQQLFAHLGREEEVETSDDETLRLMWIEHLVTSQSYPDLWRLFFIVPGSKGYGLENENHGHGYHVHYVDTKKKATRTNAVLTFDPTEAKAPTKAVPQDALYWYKHAGKISVDPDRFSITRKVEVHTLCVGFLSRTPKSHFVTPPRVSKRLWP
jgi:hypothetical protein